jgi:hypothetical protein
MYLKQRNALLTAMFAACAVTAFASDRPCLLFRLEAPHTASDEAWAKTFGMLKENPGLCDEVWFGTGFGMPTLETHRANAARIRRAMDDVGTLGWKSGLQIQATIGHGGPFCKGYDYSGRDWTGWTGSTGVEDKYCNCPRDPRFLGYMREMARIYAANHPSSVWIDDDIRINNHYPASRDSLDGCWCKRCIADFNAEVGGSWTRETLAAAARKDAALKAEWERFAIRSIAVIARIIGEEFHTVSPETMLALQHGMSAKRTIDSIVDALCEVGGAPVGYRPGASAYYDVNPNDQIVKSLSAARYRRVFERPERISQWASEIACFPRTYGTKSAQSIVMEAFTGIVFGLDAASALVVNYGKESEELYSRTRLKPMAAAAPVLRAYAKSCEGAMPAGFSSDAHVKNLYAFAQSGVPVLFGLGKSLGALSEKDIALDRCQKTSAEIQNARDALDERAGRTPAVVESPFVGLMLPRVMQDGTLRSVAIENLRVEAQGPVRLRLRGVPAEAKCATWREMGCEPVELRIIRDGDVCRVEVPSVKAWNGGFVDFAR